MVFAQPRDWIKLVTFVEVHTAPYFFQRRSSSYRLSTAYPVPMLQDVLPAGHGAFDLSYLLLCPTCLHGIATVTAPITYVLTHRK